MALLVGATAVTWSGCRESDPVGDDRNLAPQTYLVEAPDFRESGFYINHLYWDGFDPDGRISHFEIALGDSFAWIEDLVWRSTFRSDSLIRFPVGGEGGQSQVLGNRFFVRAVDLQGRPDPEPAWIFFNARDAQFPEIQFTTSEGFNPNFPSSADPAIFQLDEIRDRFGNLICDVGFPPDTLPANSNVRFAWTGSDSDSLFGTSVGEITRFEYKLSSIDNTFRGGTLADTTASYDELAEGQHTFFVRTFDDGGLVGESCRYFQVNFDPRCMMSPVLNSCTGEQELAFRLSSRQYGTNDNTCAPDFMFEDWDPVVEGMPELSVNPCLPPGYFATNDTIPAAGNRQAWWFEVEGSCFDLDGELSSLDANFLSCRTTSSGVVCQPGLWDCAAIVEAGGDTTLVIGPIKPGDSKFVLAGVDDLGQRGAANADTLSFLVDFAPRLAFVTDRLPNDTCNQFAATLGDTITVCDSDSTLIVTTPQVGSVSTPCAYQTRFLGGGDAGISAADYNSLPLPGGNYDLEFFEIPRPDQPSLWRADMQVQLWMYDVDGTRRVDHVRWGVDGDPRPTTPFERVTNLTSVAPEGELTPACFEAIILHDGPLQQDVEHSLHLEIVDHLPGGIIPAAARKSKQVINFTVNDVAGARYTLTGSK